MLARRELSAAQLRERLVGRECSEDEADQVVRALQRDGAVDDARAARAYARTSMTIKGRGRVRVERELDAMGIARDTARQALAETLADIDETDLIERALAKKLRTRTPDAAAVRRAHAALIRLGFPPAAVAAALRRRGRDIGDD